MFQKLVHCFSLIFLLRANKIDPNLEMIQQQSKLLYASVQMRIVAIQNHNYFPSYPAGPTTELTYLELNPQDFYDWCLWLTLYINKLLTKH